MGKRSRIERFKRILVRCFYYSGAYFILSRLVRRKKAVIIIAYHRISQPEDEADYISTLAVTADAFKKQMDYLTRSYEVIPLTEACQLLKRHTVLDKDYVVITCDDGYADNYINGLPVFSKYGLRPIIYLTTGYIGAAERIWHDQIDFMVRNSRNHRVDIEELGITAGLNNNSDKADLAFTLMQRVKKLPDEERRSLLTRIAARLDTVPEGTGNELLTWQQVRAMVQCGCEMGSHTVTHAIMSALNREHAREELLNSQSAIAQETGRPCSHFAYPDGQLTDIDGACESLVREIYSSAVTTEPGVNYPGCDLYRLRRIGVIKEMDVVYLKVKILMTRILK